MKICKTEKIPDKTAAALGFFDGVHRGHMSLVKTAADAKKRGLLPLVYTFDVHPLKILGKSAPPCITTGLEQQHVFKGCNIDILYFQHTTPEFLKMPCERFFNEIIIKTLNSGCVIIGENYTFGAGGGGDAALMKRLCEKSNIRCEILPYVRDGDDKIISSSRIRECILAGDLKQTEAMLGRRYFIGGRVTHGRADGRKMGFPTINTQVGNGKILPPNGVYATSVNIGGRRFKSVTNIGSAPTFGENPKTVETNILQFSGDVYGENLFVEFLCRIRGEKRFESVAALREQIKADTELRNGLDF